MLSPIKYSVTIVDKHGDEDVVDVYAANIDDVPVALDHTYGDDYQRIVNIDSL